VVDIGKFLILIGIALAIAGAVLLGLGRAGLKGLPGDIHYQSQHTQIYFPIVSCIVLSILLTLGMWIWRWLAGK
jgi:hypothetical protein